MLSFAGVSPGRAIALRELTDLGIAVDLERETDRQERCIIEGRGRRVVGTGPTADAAAADALERWASDPG